MFILCCVVGNQQYLQVYAAVFLYSQLNCYRMILVLVTYMFNVGAIGMYIDGGSASAVSCLLIKKYACGRPAKGIIRYVAG